MSKLTDQEQELLALIRNIKPFEDIAIKRNEKGEIVFTYTQRQRIVVLTHTM